MSSQADYSAWDELRKAVKPSQPFIEEFPSLVCWTNEDEAVSRAVRGHTAQNSYLRGAVLGVGGFARVWKIMKKVDGALFAGKTSKVDYKLGKEARVLRRLKHEHILKYEGFYEDKVNPENTMLLTELCAGGDLNTHINNSTRGMPPVEILRVIQQAAAALEYLHAQSLFHSDLKPRNIFIRSFSPMTVVLGDCADVKDQSYRGKLMGTPAYYSPEMLQHKQHMGLSDDIWALGVSALGMAMQWPRVIYVRNGQRDERQIQEYPRQCWEHVEKLAELNPGHGIVGLMERMLVWGPVGRIAAGELRETTEEVLQRWDVDEELGIKTPADFQPIEFW